MTTASSLALLTLVRNRPIHLQRLVEGLVRGEVMPAELVVVDMSDTPVTLPPTPFPSLRLGLETTGLPLAEARNLAARTSTAKRLLFLDVDCIPAAELVGRMDAALQAQDALICAEIQYLGAGDVTDTWTEAQLQSAGQVHPVRAFPREGLRREHNAGFFWSLAFGIRRSSYERLGGFDERYSGYGAEDTDFGFRAEEAELPLFFMSGPGAFHQHHGVFDPPLQHFEDILRNAETFRSIWGRWPMTGWLDAFQARGLIVLHQDRIERLRNPTAHEVDKSRKPDHLPF